MDTVMQSLQDLVDRRAMESVQASKARGHSEIEAARGYSKKAHRGAEAIQYPPVIKSSFTFHDLRAKSVSDAKSLQDAYERAGHTSMAMTRGVYDRGIRDVEPLE